MLAACGICAAEEHERCSHGVKLCEPCRQCANAAEVERIERNFHRMGAEYFANNPNLQAWAKENPSNPIPSCYRGWKP